jgi:hypothetical protein
MQTSTDAGPTAKRAISPGKGSTMKAKVKVKRKPTAKPSAATAPVMGQPAASVTVVKGKKPLPPWLIKAKKKQQKVRKQG